MLNFLLLNWTWLCLTLLDCHHPKPPRLRLFPGRTLLLVAAALYVATILRCSLDPELK